MRWQIRATPTGMHLYCAGVLVASSDDFDLPEMLGIAASFGAGGFDSVPSESTAV